MIRKSKYDTIESVNLCKPLDSRLTAINFLESTMTPKGFLIRQVECLCICGVLKRVGLPTFIKGTTKSCGCLSTEEKRGKQPPKYKTVEQINLARPAKSILTASELVPCELGAKKKKNLVSCQCACGSAPVVISVSRFVTRNISCGCLSRVEKYKNNIQQIYKNYRGMLNRCYLKTNKRFKHYGGAGVSVCDEWKNDYQKFLDWSLANGWAPNLSLDKDIKYIEKHPEAKTGKLYSPEYCQYVTTEVNNEHTSRSVKFEYKGEMKPAKEVAKLLGVSYIFAYRRLKSGLLK